MPKMPRLFLQSQSSPAHSRGKWSSTHVQHVKKKERRKKNTKPITVNQAVVVSQGRGEET